MNLENLKKFCENQFNNFEGNEEEYKDMIYFIFEGSIIINPFLDESGIIEVNPIEYYKEYFLNSDFIKLLEE